MQRTRVKICGVTCVEDALVAAAAGADAIGLIFHPPASRAVSILAAEKIVAALPPFTTPVGLFLDALPEHLTSIASRLKIQWIQLHGHETPAQVEGLKQFHVIKAIHVKPGRLQESLQPWREALAGGRLPHLRAIVLETGWAHAQGGTGIENDWEQIRAVQASGGFDDLPPLILAGGLRPSTVGQVVEMLRPLAVDVSSGVEEVKGRKSTHRVHAFIRAVRIADHNCNHIPTSAF
jgi:phosphoribosylanthranilate isomerase